MQNGRQTNRVLSVTGAGGGRQLQAQQVVLLGRHAKACLPGKVWAGNPVCFTSNWVVVGTGWKVQVGTR